MPKISEFFGIAIYMYFDDHPPSHFHARYAEFEAVIQIDDLMCTTGKPASACPWSRGRVGHATSERLGLGVEARPGGPAAVQDRTVGVVTC